MIIFIDSSSYKNIIRNIVYGLIGIVCLVVFSCGKKDSTHNYDPTNWNDTWNWTLWLGTSSNEYGGAVTTDSSNNIYITGSTDGSFDGFTNIGSWDIFLVKYNSTLSKQWIQQLGTSSIEIAYDVEVDSSNNIYVTGRTAGGLDGNNSSGGDDLYLIKYNSSGVKQWTKQLGTSASDLGKDMSIDSSDNIYVTGYAWGDLDGNIHSGVYDLFLVKYNSSGVKQWTKQFGTSTYDYGYGVTVDSSDNIYVTGDTKGGLDGNTNSGGNDLFLLKYNSSGVKQWTKQLGTTSNERDQGGVAIDSSDNIYLAGYTEGGLDGNTNSGGMDIFLVKYNSSGVKQWTKQLGTTSNDMGTSVAIDSSDNIYLTGYTEGGLDGNTNSGGKDIFLVKYNSSGVKQWTKQLINSAKYGQYSITIDSSNSIFITGETTGKLDGNNSFGGQDIFLLKFNLDGERK